jgi:seryl-tRNA synthetase
MLDPKILRSDLDLVAEKLLVKKYELDKARFTDLEESRKKLQVETQNLQNERNKLSKAIGQAKSRGEDAEPLLRDVESRSADLKSAETRLAEIQGDLDYLLLRIPNLPDESVPAGDSEDDNTEVLRWGEPRQFDFEPAWISNARRSCPGRVS